MILVDSSVWIDHLRSSEATLAGFLSTGRVLVHPFVIGEIALGYMRNRASVVRDISKLKQATTASDVEVLHLIEQEQLFGSGIGYIDAHLLASVRLTPQTELWTRDKRLRDIAKRMKIAAGAV
jgi:predicted nucleic acid-binding protein